MLSGNVFLLVVLFICLFGFFFFFRAQEVFGSFEKHTPGL